MAKKRQSIRDIQAALKGNTSFIGSEEESAATDAKEAPTPEVVEVIREVVVEPSGLVLDDARSEKLRILAAFQGKEPEELLRLAVDDLLDLRRRQLSAAMEAKEKP